jgi:hypothetical protein
MDHKDIDAFASVIPIGRMCTPADVANAVCYLASSEASFITGVNLQVCKDSDMRYAANPYICTGGWWSLRVNAWAACCQTIRSMYLNGRMNIPLRVTSLFLFDHFTVLILLPNLS